MKKTQTETVSALLHYNTAQKAMNSCALNAAQVKNHAMANVLLQAHTAVETNLHPPTIAMTLFQLSFNLPLLIKFTAEIVAYHHNNSTQSSELVLTHALIQTNSVVTDLAKNVAHHLSNALLVPILENANLPQKTAAKNTAQIAMSVVPQAALYAVPSSHLTTFSSKIKLQTAQLDIAAMENTLTSQPLTVKSRLTFAALMMTLLPTTVAQMVMTSRTIIAFPTAHVKDAAITTAAMNSITSSIKPSKRCTLLTTTETSQVSTMSGTETSTAGGTLASFHKDQAP